jgi:putative transposase
MPTLRYAGGMADYRRYFIAGGTYFFTIVTYRRRVLFDKERNVQLLREAIASVQADAPFEINAAIILPDHMHFIWSLPPGDADYSKRIGRMKASFTKAFYADRPKPEVVSESRKKHRESDIWQRRFWEHTITDEDEFERLFDYIHFNPVKHGHATCPHAWTASSFHKWVDAGVLDREWGCSCEHRTVTMSFDKVEGVVGE